VHGVCRATQRNALHPPCCDHKLYRELSKLDDRRGAKLQHRQRAEAHADASLCLPNFVKIGQAVAVIYIAIFLFFFSQLGIPAQRAVAYRLYFACVNSFFNDCSENNYLRI